MTKNEPFEILKQINYIRASGSAKEKEAAIHLQSLIKSWGLNAWLEEFEVPLYKVEEAFISAKGKSYAASPLRNSPAIDIEAPFYYVDQLREADFATCQGGVVLTQSVKASHDKLKDSGIKGILLAEGRAIDPPSYRHPQGNGFDFEAYLSNVPTLRIHIQDALQLLKEEVKTVHFKLQAITYKGTSQNVVADVPGAVAETLLVGGHYDSVPEGPGIRDNGGGSAIVASMAHYFSKHPLTRSLRFIFFGAEEIGLYGSRDYIKRHRDELSKYPMLMNIDVAGSAIGSNHIMVQGYNDLVRQMCKCVAELNYPAEVNARMVGSDSTPFGVAGVPSFMIARGSHPGLSFNHTKDDRIEFVDPKQLDAMAEFCIESLKLIDSRHKLAFRRGLTPKLTKEYEKRMKLLYGE